MFLNFIIKDILKGIFLLLIMWDVLNISLIVIFWMVKRNYIWVIDYQVCAIRLYFISSVYE